MTVDGTGAVAVATGLSGGELMIELAATLERPQTTATFDVPQQTLTHDHQHADQQHAQNTSIAPRWAWKIARKLQSHSAIPRWHVTLFTVESTQSLGTKTWPQTVLKLNL